MGARRRQSCQVAPIDSQEKALFSARVALDKLAEDVVVMDLRPLSSVTDFFVICTVGSLRQLTALQDHIEDQLTQQGHRVWHIEGTKSNPGSSAAIAQELQWSLLDCGDFVVHLMNERARELYQLERLWGDAVRIPLTAST